MEKIASVESVQEEKPSKRVSMKNVFSTRPGDIILRDGSSLRYNEVKKITTDEAQDLVASFPGLIRIVE